MGIREKSKAWAIRTLIAIDTELKTKVNELYKIYTAHEKTKQYRI